MTGQHRDDRRPSHGIVPCGLADPTLIGYGGRWSTETFSTHVLHVSSRTQTAGGVE